MASAVARDAQGEKKFATRRLNSVGERPERYIRCRSGPRERPAGTASSEPPE